MNGYLTESFSGFLNLNRFCLLYTSFNYFSVYYNQVRDVHPPLFYGLVHFVSSIAYGHFSKYIICSINIVLFILLCIEIRKILKLLNKKYLSIPAILLYGLNIGTISTVIFLRMYQMLVFFTLVSLKLHIEDVYKRQLELYPLDKYSRLF